MELCLGQGYQVALWGARVPQEAFQLDRSETLRKIDLGFIFCSLGLNLLFSFDCGFVYCFPFVVLSLSVFSPPPVLLLSFLRLCFPHCHSVAPSQTPTPLCPLGFQGPVLAEGRQRGQMGADPVSRPVPNLLVCPHPRGQTGSRTRRRAPPTPSLLQCFLLLLALTGGACVWQLELWRQACNLEASQLGVGSQLWLWPPPVGLPFMAKWLTFLWTVVKLRPAPPPLQDSWVEAQGREGLKEPAEGLGDSKTYPVRLCAALHSWAGPHRPLAL